MMVKVYISYFVSFKMLEICVIWTNPHSLSETKLMLGDSDDVKKELHSNHIP